METADEILIELNRSQAITKGASNAQWENSVPSIILEEGDTIRYMGGWLSVKNSGDDSIQIVDPENPESPVDISFKFSFYKTLNGQNIVTYPYHSFKWTTENTYPQDFLAYGFSCDPNKNGEKEYNLSNSTNYPKIANSDNPFIDGAYYNDAIAKHATYDSLINEQDADKYNLSRDTGYIHFLTNAGLTQGIRDLANNNDRYTAMYQKTDNTWETYTHTVSAKFSPQYASPTNVASFITESMQQQRKLVTAYPDSTPIKEVWTNSGRFFRTIEPYALPHVNYSTVPSGFQTPGTSDDPVTTQGSWGSVAVDCPTQTGLVLDFQLVCTDITYEDPTNTTVGQGNRVRIRGTFQPQDIQQARQWNYIYHIARGYTGDASKYYKQNTTQLEYQYNTTQNSGAYATRPANATQAQLNQGYGAGGLSNYSVYPLNLHCPDTNSYQIGISNKDGQKFQGANSGGKIGGTMFGVLAYWDNGNPFPGSSALNPLSVSAYPMTYDNSTGSYGEYTLEFFILQISDLGQTGVTAPTAANGMTPALNTELELRISVGGNPINDLFVVADPPPMGCPLWIGSESVSYPGQPYGDTTNDADYASVGGIKAAARNVNSQTADPYTWCPYILDISGGQLDIATTTTGTEGNFYLNINSRENHSKLDYSFGQRCIGNTSQNFNRWSLLNFQLPDKTDDPENDVDYLPTMVKYPKFRAAGCKLWNKHSLMMNADRNLSTVTFSPREQDDKKIVEEDSYATESEARARCDLYRAFFQSQIDSGMIDTSQTDLADSGGRPYFPAYTHIALTLGANTYNANGTLGNASSWRERPRGFLVAVDENSFNSTDPIQSANDPNRKYYGGVIYEYDPTNNYYKIEVQGYSWIYDKSYGNVYDNGSTGTGFPTNCNFGFLDMNAQGDDYTGGSGSYTKCKFKDGAGNINKLQDADNGVADILNYGFGYSDRLTGWRNNTAYLSSSQLRKADDYQYIFDFTKNRQSNQYESWYETSVHPKSLYSKGTGQLQYANRYFLGAREPILAFGVDGNSRFFFSQLYQPMQVQNDFRAGTSLTDSDQVLTTCVDPLYNLQDLPADGVVFTPGDSTATPVPPGTFTITQDSDENAGSDCVHFQRRLWNLQEGLPMFATEIPKHYPMYWKTYDSAVNDTNRYSGNHWGGESFTYNYPVLDDDTYNSRFFMFPQQARVNSFQTRTILQERYVTGTQRDSAGNLKNQEIKYLNVGIGTEKGKGSIPSHSWGSLPGDRIAFISNERKTGQPNQVRVFQNGTDCPNAEQIYDVQGGVALFDFMTNNKDNWNSSLWATMGFDYFDLSPAPFCGISNQRNFTKNFLQDLPDNNYDKNVFHSQSNPVTCNAELTTSGFIANTTNVIGENNYTGITPFSNLLYTGNIPAEQTLSVSIQQTTGYESASDGYNVIFNRVGGSNLSNNELFENQFFNLKLATNDPYGSYVLASNVPSKLEVPFYLIKSDLVENNYEFVNNANFPSQMPVVGNVALQYGATSDFYYSENQFDNVYINKKRRVITSIRTELVDSNGNLASTLEDKSSIFVKITRADPKPLVLNDGDNLYLKEQRLKDPKLKKEEDDYEEEIEEYLGLAD